MSSLNQAFIKAYQRRGVGAPHIPLPAPAAEKVAGNHDAPPPSGAVRAFDGKAAAVPPAHLFIKSSLSTASAGRYAADDVPPLEPPTPVAAPVTTRTDRQPDVALARETAGDEVNAFTTLAPDLDLDRQPAYEVERFEWPAVVTSLAGEADAELSALVGELLPEGKGTLLVTGCRRGEGRTSVALMLARHLARAGRRVLVIDADFQRPNVAASLATDAEVGWTETLADASPHEAMIESLADRLVILPLRAAVDGAAPTAALHELCGNLLDKFDVLTIDMGPLVETSVGRDMQPGPAPVAAIVVRDVRHARLEQSHAVGRKLVTLGVNRWAIIENFV